MRKTAQAFHRDRRGNCAQAVAYAWGNKYPGGRGVEEVFAGCGGGKAPEGLCGAVHASCLLADGSEVASIKREFAEKSDGLLSCKEIRKLNKLTCNECVGLAAELLEKHARKLKGID